MGRTTAHEIHPEKRREIAREPFPHHERRVHLVGSSREVIPPINQEGLKVTVTGLQSGKAASPNRISAGAVMAVDPHWPVRIFSHLLWERRFPDEWKRATVVLIPKPGRTWSCRAPTGQSAC